MSYGNEHRYLLRTVGCRGVITKAETLRLLAESSGLERDSIDNMVKEINSMIRPFQQKIKIVHDDYSDEEVLIFISMADDDISKAQNYFSATDLEYFRVLLEQIVTSDARQITRLHALNLVGNMKASFTKTEAEKLLKKWSQMRYLDQEGNNFMLGVRTIHEFEGYFRQNMPDAVEECCLCKTIVFQGYNCPACALAVHTRCLQRYVNNVPKWPCCKVNFSQEQLETLNCDSSSVSSTQPSQDLEATQLLSQLTEDMETDTQEELTQQLIPEMSQRVTRKRKRNC